MLAVCLAKRYLMAMGPLFQLALQLLRVLVNLIPMEHLIILLDLMRVQVLHFNGAKMEPISLMGECIVVQHLLR